jgi:multicomponent Na+:H+ antiporter subunit G
MKDLMIMVLCGGGTLFIFLAAVGILRMPDFFLRVSVTTKAVTLGSGLILLAAALYFSQPNVSGRVFAIILFILLTAPVGAHMIAKAAFRTGEKLWNKSVQNDLENEDW